MLLSIEKYSIVFFRFVYMIKVYTYFMGSKGNFKFSEIRVRLTFDGVLAAMLKKLCYVTKS